MLRSMYSAISGMNAFQTELDVVGNNIANVDTTGYKASRTEFSDILSQTMAGASQPANTGPGGTNPEQVGLGVNVASIYTPFTQGADQETGVNTDVALDGNGFFIVSPAATTNAATATDTESTVTPIGTNPVYYTRAGDFSADASGDIVTPDGSKLMGYLTWTAGATVPAGTQIMVNGNMYKTTNGGTSGSTPPTGWTNTNPPTDGTVNWQYVGPAALQDLGAVNVGVVQSAGAQPVPGNFTINPNGTITVSDPANNQTVETWMVPLANFFNPSGLSKVGNNEFAQTADSGQFGSTATAPNIGASIGQAGTNGLATFRVGALEASNVNLTNEFTNMIVAQQAFDANSKVINTDNNILSTVLTLEQQA